MAGADSKTAVALDYAPETRDAPTVTAIGRGHLAERVLAIAEAHAVPIHRDPALVRMLSRAEVGDTIPVEAYEAVARILAVLLSLDAQRRGTV